MTTPSHSPTLSYSPVSSLSDRALLDQLAHLVAVDRTTTASLLEHLAEVDIRKLYLPAACASLHAYCVEVLGLSADAAFRRITAARAARRHPVLYAAIADGRLNLTAVGQLVPHLTDENVDDLVAAAAHRSRMDIARLLAERFPRPDLPDRISRVAEALSLVSERVTETTRPVTRVEPLAPQRYALQMTIGQATHEKLERAAALLRHREPSGDLGAVLDRALDALLAQLERERLAAARRPQAARPSTSRRHIPHAVRRAVFARDGERCTFVASDGRRCSERGFLELDHIEPVARGGASTPENLRVRCHAHNQHAAVRIFGSDFMARQRAGRAPALYDADALGALTTLGFTAKEARHALEASAASPITTLEDRLRAALAELRPRARSA